MPKFLLSAAMRLFLIICAGLSGLVLKGLDASLDDIESFSGSPLQFVMAVLVGIALLILFFDMANYGYSAVKLKQYPPLGLKYISGWEMVKQ